MGPSSVYHIVFLDLDYNIASLVMPLPALLEPPETPGRALSLRLAELDLSLGGRPWEAQSWRGQRRAVTQEEQRLGLGELAG